MDGTDHINVYSKGNTQLGRMLSNFYQAEIFTRYGSFMSIEGLWYWMGLSHEWDNPAINPLRDLSGNAAKLKGQELRKRFGQTEHPDFEGAILRATEYKIISKPQLLQMYLENDLPLVHYYVMRGAAVFNDSNKFQIDFLNGELRQSLGLEPL